MSVSLQSSLHAVAKANPGYEAVAASKDASHTATSTAAAPKPAPRLNEVAEIKLLAQEGHSVKVIAASVGLPETVVALTLADSAAPAAPVSSASALAALNAHISLVA